MNKLAGWIAQLDNPDDKLRKEAYQGIEAMAKQGEDISAAVPALERTIRKLNGLTAGHQIDAAIALTYHYLNQGNARQVERLLSKEKSWSAYEWAARTCGEYYATRKNWRKLCAMLGGESHFKTAAVAAIWGMVREGKDITRFGPALFAVFTGNDPYFTIHNVNCARGVITELTRQYAVRGRWGEVERLLDTDRLGTEPLYGIQSAFEKGVSIEPVVALLERNTDRTECAKRYPVWNSHIRDYCRMLLAWRLIRRKEWREAKAWILRTETRSAMVNAILQAARNQEVVEPVLSVLQGLLDDGRHSIHKSEQGAIFFYHYLKERNWDAIGELVRNESPDHLGSSWGMPSLDKAFLEAMERGLDITPSLEQVGMLLGSNKGHASSNAYSLFWQLAEKCNSLSFLDAMENALETGFLAWIRTHPPATDPVELKTRIEYKSRIVGLRTRIAERKAKMSKEQDGKLLAGETVPKPTQEGRRGYRILARRL